jgi:hypothetical protein
MGVAGQSPQRPDEFGHGFVDGHHRPYQNLGFLQSPYPGKVGEGDYGPLQGGQTYYRPGNPTYPYGMDAWTPPTQYAKPGPYWLPHSAVASVYPTSGASSCGGGCS